MYYHTYCFFVAIIGMLETVDMFFGLAMCKVKFAFNAGSSKQGNALRASVAWNCVEANHLYKVK